MVGHTIYHPNKGSTLTFFSMIGHTIYHLGKGSALTSISMIGHTIYHLGKGSVLTSDHVGANPIVTSEWLFTYIWSCGNTSHSHIRMDPARISNHGRNQSYHVRKDLRLVTSPLRELLSGEHQASPWSTQTSLWPMAWSTHQLSIRLSQHTRASLLSAPYPWYSDILSQYALTGHGTLGSQTTSHNSSCCNIYK